MRNLFLILFFQVVFLSLFAQKTVIKAPEKPKLIVGIIVDQMRYDYLYRYWDKYGNGGFKRLLSEGYNFENCQYNYVPTSTGPGHASVYTGTTPSIHGIAGNEWYVRETGHFMYVTEDTTVAPVGINSAEGKMSPKNLLSTTITDELRLFNNMQSKVIGVSLKDRGSILPAGHIPNAAYWYDGKTGNWITSSYYMNELPVWVKEFNNKKLPEVYLSKPWSTYLPIAEYSESLPDNQKYKQSFSGEAENKFPHDLPILKAKSGFDLLRSTPFGNTFTLDFALKIIEAENLGKGKYTDFLALSFSSTDYIGHRFGVHSIEVEDTYIRLDKEIERLLTYLDQNLGKNNSLIFLTADHAGAYTPKYLKEIGIPSGYFNEKYMDTLKTKLNKEFGNANYVLAYENSQLYLNRQLLSEKKIKEQVENYIKEFLLGFEGVVKVIRAEDLGTMNNSQEWVLRIQNGIYPKRSGDLIVVFEPGWFDSSYAANGGTTHGSGYNYDTHVPLLWHGWSIKKGASAERVNITDIASTLAGLLNIMEPNGSIGRNLEDIIKLK
jgi:predicted AlkP superfamily pyrophosphatase or phosphodiesterase